MFSPCVLTPFSCVSGSTLGSRHTLELATYTQSLVFRDDKVVVLVDDAVGSLLELFIGLMFPPVPVVAIAVELTAAVVETVCDLVTDDVADGTVVQVIWTVLVEEDALQNASRELDLQQHSLQLRGLRATGVTEAAYAILQ